MLPVKQDLSAYRGDSWAQGFRFLRGTTPVNLTGVSVSSQARSPDEKRTSLLVEITNATDGRFNLRMPPSGLPPANYEYDIEVNESGAITTWVKGELTVFRDVTNELG